MFGQGIGGLYCFLRPLGRPVGDIGGGFNFGSGVFDRTDQAGRGLRSLAHCNSGLFRRSGNFGCLAEHPLGNGGAGRCLLAQDIRLFGYLGSAQSDVAFELAPPLALDEASAQAQSTALAVLVVEDNPVNQTVARRILEKAGHHVTIANNGAEALEAFDSRHFDLILMDVQMPVMGGIDATQAIRAREARRSWVIQGDWRPTAIIAMTAHAMAGDRERCLEAGMDDYVSKPIHVDALFAAIDRVLSRPVLDESEGDVSLLEMGEGDRRQIANLDEARAMFDGDEDVVQQLLALFFRDFDRTITDLQRASAALDYKRLAELAHVLKGSVGLFGAQRATEAAKTLEQMARSGDPAAATTQATKLSGELKLLAQALHQHERKH